MYTLLPRYTFVARLLFGLGDFTLAVLRLARLGATAMSLCRLWFADLFSLAGHGGDEWRKRERGGVARNFSKSSFEHKWIFRYKEFKQYFTMIPWDCVLHALTFMPLDVAVQLVSKAWVRAACFQAGGGFKSWGDPPGSHMTWAHRLRLCTHAAVVMGDERMEHEMDSYWQDFGRRVLGKRRRKRNDYGVLTWRARVQAHMLEESRCRACGCRTTACVLGRVLLCQTCRADWRLKHAFMVKVHQIRPWLSEEGGRHVLRQVPYHGGNAPFCPHWRFWTDVRRVASYLDDTRSMRRRVAASW